MNILKDLLKQKEILENNIYELSKPYYEFTTFNEYDIDNLEEIIEELKNLQDINIKIKLLK